MCRIPHNIAVYTYLSPTIKITSFFYGATRHWRKSVHTLPEQTLDKLTSKPVLPHHFVSRARSPCEARVNAPGVTRRKPSPRCTPSNSIGAATQPWPCPGGSRGQPLPEPLPVRARIGPSRWTTCVPPLRPRRPDGLYLLCPGRVPGKWLPSCAWPPPKLPRCGLPLLVWQKHLLAEGTLGRVAATWQATPEIPMWSVGFSSSHSFTDLEGHADWVTTIPRLVVPSPPSPHPSHLPLLPMWPPTGQVWPPSLSQGWWCWGREVSRWSAPLHKCTERPEDALQPTCWSTIWTLVSSTHLILDGWRWSRTTALARSSWQPGNMELGRGQCPMTMFATTGCLSLIILMQSAQLDQNAATLDLTADISQVLPWPFDHQVIIKTPITHARNINNTLDDSYFHHLFESNAPSFDCIFELHMKIRISLKQIMKQIRNFKNLSCHTVKKLKKIIRNQN